MQPQPRTTKHWLNDILVVRISGTCKEEGIVQIRGELSRYVLSSGKRRWRRLTLLAPDTFDPPEIYPEMEAMYQWDHDHGCYAIAVVINNHLQAKLVSELRANNKFNMQIFTDKHLALGWLDQQSQGLAVSPAAMPAHGHSELHWQEDILIIQASGAYNLEGLQRAADELKHWIARANKKHWFRLISLDDDTLGPPDVYEGVIGLHRWAEDNGCLATAMISASPVQTGLINSLIEQYGFNIRVFANQADALQWLNQFPIPDPSGN